MKVLKALGSGLVGACALTLVHETARRFLLRAPRMDVLGMRAIARTMRSAEAERPRDEELHTAALVGDIISNSLYYSLVGLGDAKGAYRRGALLGSAAGLGGVLLPGPLGLGSDASARTPATQAMTVAWYMLGGLAAAAAFSAVATEDRRAPRNVRRRRYPARH